MDKTTIQRHLRNHINAAKERAAITPEELHRRALPAHLHVSMLEDAARAKEEAEALQTALNHVSATYDVGRYGPLGVYGSQPGESGHGTIARNFDERDSAPLDDPADEAETAVIGDAQQSNPAEFDVALPKPPAPPKKGLRRR